MERRTKNNTQCCSSTTLSTQTQILKRARPQSHHTQGRAQKPARATEATTQRARRDRATNDGHKPERVPSKGARKNPHGPPRPQPEGLAATARQTTDTNQSACPARARAKTRTGHRGHNPKGSPRPRDKRWTQTRARAQQGRAQKPTWATEATAQRAPRDHATHDGHKIDA